MARLRKAPGEKPLFWVGSAKEDLLEFPEAVKDEIGDCARRGPVWREHPSAKPWHGEGPGIFEIVEDHKGDTYRVVYTVKFEHAMYVLHAFQKKSPKGVKTTRTGIELIWKRLRIAAADYEARYGKRKN